MRNGGWSLAINAANADFADLSATSAILELRSLACDCLRISSQNKFAFEEGDEIELFFGGARKFKGECASIKTSLSAQKKSY
ncbi:MAG: hypothetical protein IKO42_06925, partial [Opitutales bacterium]|nr:hypothetical protein [Opitutales bacterium]